MHTTHSDGMVSILMSIYRPNLAYLREQLISLNEQTYENLELVVWNDCPEEPTPRELFQECITRFPVRFDGGTENLGYLGAFEKLCTLAHGEFLCFCDQDDIWEREKIEKCVRAMEKEQSIAAVCDRALMDEQGNILCESVRRANPIPRFDWHSGDDITTRAAFSSYATGMTMIAKKDLVLSLLPLVPVLPHDQQLIFLLSGAGKVSNVEEPLVRHRRHGKNASGTLTGVQSKQDYYDTRCVPVRDLIDKFKRRFPEYSKLDDMRACCEARIKGSIRGIWKYRDMIPELYRYEILLALCPACVFRVAEKVFLFFVAEKG